MPIDDWFVFAYCMLFSSIIICGLVPMFFRLLNARQRYYDRFQFENESSIHFDYELIPYIDDDNVSV